MSEITNYVLGNPFATFKGVHYVAKNGCADGDEDADFDVGNFPADCDPAPTSVSKKAEDIEFINRQPTAIEQGLSAAQLEVKRRLLSAYEGRKEVRVIVEDQFALVDLVKKGNFHSMFNRRFSRTTGKSIDDCGDLVDSIRNSLQVILHQIKLFVQLDHSDNVKNYLRPDVYEKLLEAFAHSKTHSGFKLALIGAPLLSRGLTLEEVYAEISRPFQLPLDSSFFSKEDVIVLFERVIRDHLHSVALNLDWDETININPQTGKPFYQSKPGEEDRNVINFPKPDKPVVACIGVVSGVPALIAHQSPGSVVKLFMEPDPVRRRVDTDIIRAGLDFYSSVLAEIPSIPNDSSSPEMIMPSPVVPELFMTRTGSEQILVGLSK